MVPVLGKLAKIFECFTLLTTHLPAVHQGNRGSALKIYLLIRFAQLGLEGKTMIFKAWFKLVYYLTSVDGCR